MTFQAFDSFEEMFAEMRRQEEAANAAVKPWQRTIGTEGGPRYWVRAELEMDLLIFGEAWTLAETQASERSYVDPELSAEEIEAEMEESDQRMADSYQRGYRFGRCYSVVCPEGELGSTHVVNMVPIDETTFRMACDKGWQPDIELVVKMRGDAARIPQEDSNAHQ